MIKPRKQFVRAATLLVSTSLLGACASTGRSSTDPIRTDNGEFSAQEKDFLSKNKQLIESAMNSITLSGAAENANKDVCDVTPADIRTQYIQGLSKPFHHADSNIYRGTSYDPDRTDDVVRNVTGFQAAVCTYGIARS